MNRFLSSYFFKDFPYELLVSFALSFVNYKRVSNFFNLILLQVSINVEAFYNLHEYDKYFVLQGMAAQK